MFRHTAGSRASFEIVARRLALAEGDDRTTWPFAPVFLVLAVGWLVLGWPWLSGRYAVPWDAAAHFVPQVQFLAQSLARGDSPFWLPYAFSGTLQIADPQSTIFSPPFLALAVVDGNPGLRAVNVTVLVTMLVCGAGLLLLLRDLGWHWAGALVAALAFLFGASMAWRLQHFGQVLSLAYLPPALLLLRRALERRSVLYGAATGAISALILLGRDQVALLSLYLMAGYVLWWIAHEEHPLRALRTVALPLASGALVAIAITVLPLLLTVLYAGRSNRPEIDFIGAGRGSLHPALLVTTVVPHLFGAAGEMAKYWGPPSFTWRGTDLFIAQNMGQLYIAAIPGLLLVAGLIRGVLWSRDIRFFTIALCLVTLYALGWFTPAFHLAYEFLPGVKLYRRPADATFLMGGLGAVVAGYVAHRLFSGTLPEPRRWQRIIEAALVAAVFALAVSFAYRFDRLNEAVVPIALAAGWFAAAAVALYTADWLRVLRPLTAAGLIIALMTVDLAINNGPNGATAMEPAELAMLEPTAANPTLSLLVAEVRARTSETDRPRIELAGLGFHWPNASLPHRLENTLGYNPVRFGIYSRATGAQDTVGLPEQRTFSPLFPSYRSTLADLLGLRFIATGVPIEEIDKRLHPGDLPLLARTKDGYVYENPRAFPRVLFAHAAMPADFEHLLATGDWPQVDFRQTVLLDARHVRAPGRRGSGTARIAAYRNTVVEIEASSAAGGWVVLNDVWHPWWRVTVNGTQAALLRANVLFRAVEVPPGNVRIRFELAPVAGALAELMGGGSDPAVDMRH